VLNSKTPKSIANRQSLAKSVKANAVYYSMLAPFAILFITFGLLPVVSAIIISFTDFDMVGFPNFTGLTNYIRLFFEDSIFPISIRNTLIFAAVTGPLGFFLSFLVAWFINDFSPRSRSFLTLVFYSPTLAGNVFFIWLFIFAGDTYGLANSTLMRLGIVTEPIQWLTDAQYNMGIVILVIIWLSMGAGFLSFVAGFQTINPEYYEAAAIDGVRNRYQELWYVTLPQMAPQLLFGAVMTISASFAVGYQSMALTGFPSTDYSTNTILLQILDYGTIRFEMGYASAIAVFLFGIMLLFWVVINRVFKKLSGN
jgi:multiple sugar transport system permease protein